MLVTQELTESMGGVCEAVSVMYIKGLGKVPSLRVTGVTEQDLFMILIPFMFLTSLQCGRSHAWKQNPSTGRAILLGYYGKHLCLVGSGFY